jgi:hypothetical protein
MAEKFGPSDFGEIKNNADKADEILGRLLRGKATEPVISETAPSQKVGESMAAARVRKMREQQAARAKFIEEKLRKGK